MEVTQDNLRKYANYREQMTRLKKAMQAEFYLEAIFIEYAIMEDRLESALRHAGRLKPGKYHPIGRKCAMLLQATKEKDIAARYFPETLLQSVLAWKEERNRLIHALMKQELHTADLRAFAEAGQQIVKTLNSKTTSYNRALQRKNAKENTTCRNR